jgi:hypothetical protein
MFIITWLFDKLGYMPKIKVDVGTLQAWPFPAPKEEPKTKPAVKKKPAAKKVIVPKASTRKPKVAAKTARTKAK